MSSEDDKLFRDAVRDVARLRVRVPVITPPKPPARARFTRADNQAVLAESLGPIADLAVLESGDELSFRREGVALRVLQRLRRGHYSVHAEIDLHGLTAIQARAALAQFIHESLVRAQHCVRVVHGKGKRSGPRGPVLKNVVNQWLRQCDAVQAFGSAPPVDGGSGAVYVLLKSH